MPTNEGASEALGASAVPSSGERLSSVDYINSLLAVLALLLGCFNTCQNWAQKELSDTKELEHHLNNAWNFLDHGDIERARQELGIVHDLNKNHPRYLLYKGFLAQRARKPDRAIEYYEGALEAQEDYVPALCYLGALFLEQGQLEEAEGFLRRAEKLSSDADESNEVGRVFILLNLGSVLLGRRELEAAKTAFEEGLRLDAENPKLHAGLGTYYARKGQMDNSVREYWEALRGDPKDPKLLASLASTLYLMDDLANAEVALRRSLDLEEDVERMKFLGVVLEEQGRIEEAAEVQRRAERTHLSFSAEELGELVGEEKDPNGRPR